MKLNRTVKIKCLLLVAIGLLTTVVWYVTLSNRHKAIVKTSLLHAFHIIDNEWEVISTDSLTSLTTPELLVDDIYRSMDGPQAVYNLKMNEEGDEVRFITGFKAEVYREGTDVHNNDFLCHTNIDYFDAIHYRNLNLPKRINVHYPRLATLSNGINELNFPDGFGFPVARNDAFLVASRTLNHNIADAFFKVKHQVEVRTAAPETQLKPLQPKGLVMLLPYDHEAPYDSQKEDPNLCTPLDLKNHSGPGADGIRRAAHWKLPQGKMRYEFEVTYQLYLQEDTRIHAMAAHLHPGATSFTLYDITEDKPLYSFKCENYENKTGLKHVPSYSNPTGIPVYKDHRYKLILETYNSSTDFSDMMAVLFLYIYDGEMDRILQSDVRYSYTAKP